MKGVFEMVSKPQVIPYTQNMIDEIFESIEESEQMICDSCKYCDHDPNERPCNSCMNWIDGYLTALNYQNKYL